MLFFTRSSQRGNKIGPSGLGRLEQSIMNERQSFETIRSLESIANHAENTLDAVEAKIRIYSRGLTSPPTRDPLPSFLEDILVDLSRQDQSQGFQGLLSLHLKPLFGAVYAAISPENTYLHHIQYQNGSFEISWEIFGKESRWIVRPTTLRWPLVKVIVISYNDGKMGHQRFWCIQSILDYLGMLKVHGTA